MAGDFAAVAGAAVAFFLIGALFMLIAVVAAGVRGEDKATMSRRDRQLRLRGEAPSYLAAGVRRLTGVGQRTPGPRSEE